MKYGYLNVNGNIQHSLLSLRCTSTDRVNISGSNMSKTYTSSCVINKNKTLNTQSRQLLATEHHPARKCVTSVILSMKHEMQIRLKQHFSTTIFDKSQLICRTSQKKPRINVHLLHFYWMSGLMVVFFDIIMIFLKI